MTGALLGLLLGVGLLLIWRSGPRAPQPRSGPKPPGRRQQLLSEAGLTGINAPQLLALQVGLGLLVLVVVLLSTGTVTVSLVFAVFGFAVPLLQVKRLAARCGTSIPPTTAHAFENAERDGTTELLAVATAASLCDRLVEGGAEHLHFYTLNKPQLTRDVCLALGIAPRARLQAVA